MQNTSNIKERIKSELIESAQGKKFVVFDPYLKEYWSEDGYTKNQSEAIIMDGGFRSESEIESFINCNCKAVQIP